MNSRLRFHLVAIISILAISIFMFGSNLQAEFSVIDDHNIVSLIGTDNTISMKEAFDYIKEDRDFQIGEYGRFRPSFQVGRAIEVYLFEGSVINYQIARLSIFIALNIVISILIINKIGFLYGYIISLILLSEPAWKDIFTRIITSEAYVIYGLVFFIPTCIWLYYGVKKDFQSHSKLVFYSILLVYFLSGLLSIGSKENFIFLIIAPMIILFLAFKSQIRSNLNRSIKLLSFLLVVYGLFIGGVMLLYFLNTDDNIAGYGLFDVSETFLKISYSFIKIFFIEWFGLIFVLIPVSFYFLQRILKIDISNIKSHVIRLCFWGALLAIFVSFQVLYYTGGLPSQMRYDFPLILFFSFYLSLLVFFMKKTLPFFVSYKYIRLMILVPLVAVFIIKDPVNGILKSRDASLQHKDRTNEFSSVINSIQDLAKKDTNSVILINSFDVWDYELISSFYKYIKYRGIENPLYLRLHYDSSDYDTSVEIDFVERLEYVSNGLAINNNPSWVSSNSTLSWGYNAINELNDDSDECISVNLKYDNKDNCKENIFYKYKGH